MGLFFPQPKHIGFVSFTFFIAGPPENGQFLIDKSPFLIKGQDMLSLGEHLDPL